MRARELTNREKARAFRIEQKLRRWLDPYRVPGRTYKSIALTTKAIRASVAVCLTALVLATCSSAPCFAATRLSLLSSAAQTATGNGAAFNVPSCKELTAVVDVTAVSGSGSPTLTVWLSGSADGGTTFTSLAPNGWNIDSTTATAGTAGAAGLRNIGGSFTATGRAVAYYGAPYSFTDTVRVNWVISGTTPSFTFSVRAVCK